MPIEQNNREKLEIVYAEPQRHLRRQLRTAFQREGFTSMEDFENLIDLREYVSRRRPDLIIVDVNFEKGDACKLIQDIRYHRLGENPFIPVIMTAWEPKRDLVRRIVDCGTDDLLLKPLSPGALFERMNMLVSRRKPFVVTSNYIGPDRRKMERGENSAPSVLVPNTLRCKALGEPYSEVELSSLIAHAQREINDQRLKRNAYQVSFLVGLVLPDLESHNVTDMTAVRMGDLSVVIEDVSERMVDTPYEHVSELCQSLLQVVNAIRDSIEKPDAKDVELLRPLSHAILVGFNPDTDAANISTEISSAIERYQDKLNAAPAKRTGT